MVNKKLIKRQLERIGNSVYLKDGSWNSTPYKAYIYPLWRRKSSAFEPAYTEVGTNSREYYLYIGPYDHDITTLSDMGKTVFDGNEFTFTRRDSVKIDNEIIYFTGILKKLKENEYAEY
ncbi:MAG: hypothetical protein PUE08_03530 [Eubacteriales bacterium]|nr:hypothetical protein [Eubacteriales bacterium]